MGEVRKWFDSSQPQTLQGAVMLCYITAIFGLILMLFSSPVGIVPIVLGVAGYGIANEKRWAYVMAIVVTALVVVLYAWFALTGAYGLLINLLFNVVLFALLLHPQSRSYQKIWFK